jgi:hypothetical protein
VQPQVHLRYGGEFSRHGGTEKSSERLSYLIAWSVLVKDGNYQMLWGESFKTFEGIKVF